MSRLIFFQFKKCCGGNEYPMEHFNVLKYQCCDRGDGNKVLKRRCNWKEESEDFKKTSEEITWLTGSCDFYNISHIVYKLVHLRINHSSAFKLFFSYCQWCWWRCDVDNLILSTISGYWCHQFGDWISMMKYFEWWCPTIRLCLLVTNTTKSVTNIF